MCKAIGAEALLEDPDFASGDKRSQHRQRLNAEIGRCTKTYTQLGLGGTAERGGRAVGPIYDIGQMFADPQVQHVGMAVPMPHPTRKDAAVVNQAVALVAHPLRDQSADPGLGEHTEEILTALGYSTNDIKALRSKKVV